MSPQRHPHEVPLEFALTNDHEQPHKVEQLDDEVESNESQFSSDKDEDEYMVIDLANLKELHCPICLGTCHLHLPGLYGVSMMQKKCGLGRRFLRDDLNYDALISTFVPNIDESQKQEDYASQVDEKIHNKETLQPQTQALDRKQKARAIALAFERRRRSIGKDLSFGDENKETKTREGGEKETQFPQEFVTVNVDGSSTHGHRSNAQVSGGNSISNRLSRFIDHLHKSDVNDDELEIPLVLVSLDKQKIPSLHEALLSCRPTMSIKILSKYVALKVELLVDQVELYLVEDSQVNIIRGELTIDPDKDKVRILRDEETLVELYTRNVRNPGFLLLAYKMK
ncbi:hypothetical protein VNO78_11821 [Psophocarpus tetragonolobus]|uniref:Uncharacterized protein n=1 Tax=Psophocarpus tetragonolobus TaxID=3891 RepID=A0AAN9SN54_PSOTE